MDTWMRILRIELTSKELKSKIVIGDDNDNLAISVTGTKYPAILKDSGVISIMNLDQSLILKIINGKFYSIDIYAGYKGTKNCNSGNGVLIFSGEVAFISQKINPTKDSECYINFTSKVVAAYSQNRMNLALNSSINVYSALDYICYSSGMNTAQCHLDENLKKVYLNEIQNYYASASTILNSVTASLDGTYTISVDGLDGTVIDITSIKHKRMIDLTSKDIPFLHNQPTVSSEGLSFTILPIFPFRVGDIVKMNNAIIDISTTSAQAYNVFNSNYMDTNGLYMITEINYTLENRGSTFEFKIKARALDIISKISTSK